MENLVYYVFPYLYWQHDKFIALAWVALIHGIFIVQLLVIFFKLRKIRKSVRNAISGFSESKMIRDPYLKANWQSYLRHFVNVDGYAEKTEDFAENYFHQTLLQRFINLRFWQNAPSMFVGLGILGTFVGLTLGLSDFQTGSPQEIQNSIRRLLGGINTAFLTSLHGIALSLSFGLIEKQSFHSFDQITQELCNLLNTRYKLTKQDEIRLKQKEQNELFRKWEELFAQRHSEIRDVIMAEFRAALEQNKKDRDAVFQKWEHLLITKDDEGRDLFPANIFRELLNESQKQSGALQAFSVDLADAVNAAIDQMMSNEMTPVFEGISQTLEKLEVAIRSFSSSTGEDIGKELGKAVLSLKTELRAIVEDFRGAFSDGAMQQLNTVIRSLDQSAAVMGQLPDTLSRMISETRQVSDDEARKRRETMSEEFENTIGNFRESVGVIMDTLNQSESRQIEREQSLLDQVNQALQKTIAQIQDMTEIQEASRDSLSKLLAETRHTIETEQSLMEQINQNTAAMLRITGAFEQIAKASAESSAQISSTSETLQDVGKSFRDDFERLSQLNHETFGQFKKALSQNQELLEEYVRKFQTIQKGLNRIFGEIDEGLKKYSQTTKQGINDYLSEFSNQLSEAAGRLSGSIEALNELFELVSDLLEKGGK